MSSGERFYLLDLSHRPALHGDIGSLLRVEGLVIGGEGAQAILMLPSAEFAFQRNGIQIPVHKLSVEEWVDFLQRSDDPEILVGPAKAFHRKNRFEISGAVQQKVWVADGFKCMFCSAKMGLTQLTIDHFTPLEAGGVNNSSNYLSACKKCNKSKGAMDPRDWCALRKLDYDFFVDYLKTRRLP